MPKANGAIIAQVKKNSPAASAGLQKADILLDVNGNKLHDYIDYRFEIAAEEVSLLVDRAGEQHNFYIEKEIDDDLGLRFTSDVFDGVKTCRCNCEFCFVAQLPKELRPPLYLKDDDYRLSFLHGNFITLTNFSQADFRRVAQYHLSPLYISVHSTEPDVRAFLMGSDKLPDIKEQMQRLCDAGIELHAQIVLCSGHNDGRHLEKTVNDLAAMFPGVSSIGIVPAGITDNAKGELRITGSAQARKIIEQVERWQQKFLKEFGTRLVWASDELYQLACRDFPNDEMYEDFPQRANGIGECRLFLDEINQIDAEYLSCRAARSRTRRKSFRLTFGTGISASGIVTQFATRLNELGIKTNVAVAANRLFGPQVTTAGLIPGSDWLEVLQRMPKTDLVILPRQSLNSDGRFLDDMSKASLQRKLGIPVKFASTPLGAAKLIAHQINKASSS